MELINTTQLLQTFWILLLMQETLGLYLPTSRYRVSATLSLMEPGFDDLLLDPTLEYYGRDQRTHTVSKEQKTESRNLLRHALENSKNKKRKSTRRNHGPSVPMATTTNSINDVHHDLVVSSLLVRRTDGSVQRKFIVLNEKKERKIVSKPKKRTKIHNWWG